MALDTGSSGSISKAICLRALRQRDSAAAIRSWETSAFGGDWLRGVLVAELGFGLAESRFGFQSLLSSRDPLSWILSVISKTEDKPLPLTDKRVESS